MIQFTTAMLDRLHREVLRILAEVGAEIAHPQLLAALDGLGAQVDAPALRVRFSPSLVEEHIARSRAATPGDQGPRFWARTSIFGGKYLDPETMALEPLTDRHLRDYFALAHALPNVTSYFITGGRSQKTPQAEPLYERLDSWKYGADNSGILYPFEAAEHIRELCETYAAMRGKTAREVSAFGVFMASPLKLAAEEAKQFVWWWERGFEVGIAHMTTGGLTAPVTTAGLVAVNIAEEIAISLLHRACYGMGAEADHPCAGASRLAFGGMMSVADMRTMMRPYGRPEMAQANVLLAAMARHYGVECFAQSGLTDAKLPSCEAGAQKAMTTLATLMGGASTLLEAGLLGIDQVFSPIQMILDEGPGGMFVASPHTAEHFRDAVWEPRVWSREMLSAWEASGCHTDVDKAREVYHRMMAEAPDPVRLDPEEENALLQIIRRVENGL